MTQNCRVARRRWPMALLAALILVVTAGPESWAARSHQRGFETPEQAVEALIDALRKHDTKALVSILGPGGLSLVFSGDSVADRAGRERFVQAYDAGHRLEAGNGKIVLSIGKDDYPVAIPVVPDGPQWRFDTEAGKEEILNRRIGRNELNAIQVCLAYVDAQREYYAQARSADGVLQYAQRMGSTPGKRDGLHWDTKPGDKPSPFGELAARARAEGYGPRAGSGQATYHGYQYRILTGQGPNAPDGALDYVAGGRMIGGFALVAFPGQYGVSGVMTFIVSHDGVVYQKDLGQQTANVARQMKRFDPDPSWQKVTPS